MTCVVVLKQGLLVSSVTRLAQLSWGVNPGWRRRGITEPPRQCFDMGCLIGAQRTSPLPTASKSGHRGMARLGKHTAHVVTDGLGTLVLPRQPRGAELDSKITHGSGSTPLPTNPPHPVHPDKFPPLPPPLVALRRPFAWLQHTPTRRSTQVIVDGTRPFSRGRPGRSGV